MVRLPSLSITTTLLWQQRQKGNFPFNSLFVVSTQQSLLIMGQGIYHKHNQIAEESRLGISLCLAILV